MELSTMVNIYTFHKGKYTIDRAGLDYPEVNEAISDLLKEGVLPQNITISNKYDLPIRKMEKLIND